MPWRLADIDFSRLEPDRVRGDDTLYFVLATSALYELIEWGVAVVNGGDLGTAYLGTQGDEWDAQKDMAFATAGAGARAMATPGQ